MMSANTTPPNKPHPLDYNVQIPVVFKAQKNPFGHNINDYTINSLRIDIPLYDDGNFDARESYSLQEVLNNFANFTDLITKVAYAMQESNFELDVCETLLDCYYGGDWAEWDLQPIRNDNYYYVLTTPELRGIEIALEFLQSPDYWHMDITEVRQKVGDLKLQLWQSLPAFYRGHTNAMQKPLSYDPQRPYPYDYIAENFIEGNRPLSRLPIDPEIFEALDRFLPDKTPAQATRITITPSPEWHGVNITSETGASISLDLDTVFSPQLDILDFVADIISNHDPAYAYVDPEGPNFDFITQSGSKRELVGLVIAHQANFSPREYDDVFSGIFDRRQLASELLKICEDKEYYFYDINNDLQEKIAFRLKRLKSIM